MMYDWSAGSWGWNGWLSMSAMMLLFAGAVALSLALMHCLAGIAMGNRDKRQIHGAVVTVAAIVLLMTATRCRLQREAAIPTAEQPLAQSGNLVAR